VTRARHRRLLVAGPVSQMLQEDRFCEDLAGALNSASSAGSTRLDRPGEMAAIVTAADRTAELAQIHVLAVVIHGDAAPLMNVSGGKATAAAVPRVELLILPKMAHDLPRELWPQSSTPARSRSSGATNIASTTGTNSVGSGSSRGSGSSGSSGPGSSDGSASSGGSASPGSSGSGSSAARAPRAEQLAKALRGFQ
jgi:hypothetical protein